jgi:hypothetical protein
MIPVLVPGREQAVCHDGLRRCEKVCQSTPGSEWGISPMGVRQLAHPRHSLPAACFVFGHGPHHERPIFQQLKEGSASLAAASSSGSQRALWLCYRRADGWQHA